MHPALDENFKSSRVHIVSGLRHFAVALIELLVRDGAARVQRERVVQVDRASASRLPWKCLHLTLTGHHGRVGRKNM